MKRLSLIKAFRITFVLIAAALYGAPLSAETSNTDNNADESIRSLSITVYKSASCGCCGDWAEHLEQQGFEVTSINQSNMSLIKQQLGVPIELQSCHTATVNGYLVEGHVPAADIKNMVNQSSSVRGLAVPGMPIGSPGMEMGDRKEAFKVISFREDGSTQVVNEYLSD